MEEKEKENRNVSGSASLDSIYFPDHMKISINAYSWVN